MKLLRFFEKILPLVFWVLLIYAFDSFAFGTLTLAAAVIHEAGHIIPACFIKNASVPSATASGFRIKLSRSVSYRDDFVITLGGPLVNLVAAFLLFFSFRIYAKEYVLIFAILNLMTALSNLLPVRGHDGYRLLETLLLIFFDSPERPAAILSFVSAFFTVVLMFLSLFFLLKMGEGYWIFFLFFASFIQEIKKSQETCILRE